jgi:hypothetical protein
MKKIFFCLIFLILCFQLISATETNIKIKTVPFKNVNVNALSSSMEVYERFNKDADEYGDVSFLFSADVPMFDLTIFVKDIETGRKVAYVKLEHQMAGEDIYAEVVPEDFVIIKTPGEENETPVENLTEEENTGLDENNTNDSLIASQEEPDEKSKISGQVVSIFGGDIKLTNLLLYALGGIVLLTAGFFTVKKVRKIKKRKGKVNGKKGNKEIRVKKLSELREEQKDTPENYYGILSETQRKLEQTQKELNQFKNQERIKEIESKIQRDQQELKKLKGF